MVAGWRPILQITSMSERQNHNADLAERVVIDTNVLDWQASPSPTVWRKRLYLDGPAEAGIVTSIVPRRTAASFTPGARSRAITA